MSSSSFVWFSTPPQRPHVIRIGKPGESEEGVGSGAETLMFTGLPYDSSKHITAGCLYEVPATPGGNDHGQSVYFLVPTTPPATPNEAYWWWMAVKKGRLVGSLLHQVNDIYHAPQIVVRDSRGEICLSILSGGPEQTGQFNVFDGTNKHRLELLEAPTIMVVKTVVGGVSWMARCDRDSWVRAPAKQ